MRKIRQNGEPKRAAFGFQNPFKGYPRPYAVSKGATSATFGSILNGANNR